MTWRLCWLGLALFVSACSSGFGEEDIAAMKKSIKDEFSKKPNVSVVEVSMFKESSHRAVGFVKLNAPYIGEITKPCSATMAEDGKNYIWRCE